MKRFHLISRLFIIFCAVAAVFPVFFACTNSLMGQEELKNRYSAQITEENSDDYTEGSIHFVRFGLWPDRTDLEQYRELLFGNPVYLRYFWNAVLLVVPILVGQCILAPLAAFGFENLSWRRKEILFFFYVVIMLMPTQVLMVPNFIVAGWLNIRDSYLAIVLPAMFHPLGVFLIRQQIKGFPKETMEAAQLDGAGEFQIYRYIVRPNLGSVVAAMLVLLFADNWNMVDQAVVFIREPYKLPLSAVLSQVMEMNPQMFFAASCFYLVPAVLMFLYGQEFLAAGSQLAELKK